MSEESSTREASEMHPAEFQREVISALLTIGREVGTQVGSLVAGFLRFQKWLLAAAAAVAAFFTSMTWQVNAINENLESFFDRYEIDQEKQNQAINMNSLAIARDILPEAEHRLDKSEEEDKNAAIERAELRQRLTTLERRLEEQ